MLFPTLIVAAEPQLSTPSKELVEIAGGAGARAWRIRYGTMEAYPKKLVSAGANRAWFSHGGWLRLIDTDQGVVVGRWHFPGSIVHLTVAGSGLQVQLQEKETDRIYTQLISFDPAGNQAITYWPSGSLLAHRLPVNEVESLFGVPAKAGVLSAGWTLTPEQDAKAMLATLEAAARRDPTAPLIRIALWRLLREMKEPRAPAVLAEALAIPSTDFTEQLPMASLLESLSEPAAAQRAFEAGYRNMLDRGLDPRLNLGLIGKMILYPTRPGGLVDSASEHGREIMERHYRLAPFSESADLAWRAYAKMMERNGRAEDARKWRTRAEAASGTALFLLPRRFAFFSDILIVLVFASLVASVVFILFLNLRYRPQRRADAKTRPDRKPVGRLLASLSFQHWSLSQRIAFLSIVAVAWVGSGIEAGMLRGIGRVAAAPISLAMGSLNGPVSRDYLERTVPASPERDLLLAYSNQQAGRLGDAEKLYRALPQFAESWNNLGVLLRGKGNEAEAKQAFEKALQVNPNLGEAALNLGRPVTEYWAEQYGRLLPGRAMLAAPAPQQVSTALFGSTLQAVCVRGLAGPLNTGPNMGAFFMLTGEGPGGTPFGELYQVLILVLFILALGLLFVPSVPVTEPPPSYFFVAEIILPGLAKRWGVLGGVVLVAWTYFVMQGALIRSVGSPFLISAIAQPSLDRSYGVPAGSMGDLMQLFGPGHFWVYYAPLAIFLVNLGLTWPRCKKTGGEGTATAP
jgi:tetratricopeptide (TPR) repeat protein